MRTFLILIQSRRRPGWYREVKRFADDALQVMVEAGRQHDLRVTGVPRRGPHRIRVQPEVVQPRPPLGIGQAQQRVLAATAWHNRIRAVPEPPGKKPATGSGPHQSAGHPAAAATGTAFDRDDQRISAQPEYADSPAAGSGDSRRMDADRAAVAANEAYRGGDLDQARQLIDQAAALDPSRARLWQQHREQVAARRLILDARAAHAAGDQQRADNLLGDARQLDPRMPAVWDGDLDASVLCPASLPRHRARSPGIRSAPAPHSEPSWRPEPTRPRRSRESRRRPTRTHRDHRGHRHQLAVIPIRSQLRWLTADRHRRRPQARRQPDRDSRSGTAAHDAGTSTKTAASDPARWPAPDPLATGQNLRPEEQTWPEPGTGQPPNGKQRQPGTAAGTEPVMSRNPQRPAAPDADWRDQILHQARQPGQPGPSWPHSPALHHTPELGAPDAGLEPGL